MCYVLTFVGFQNMVTVDLYGVVSHTVVALSQGFELTFESCSTDCDENTSGFLTELSFCDYFQLFVLSLYFHYKIVKYNTTTVSQKYPKSRQFVPLCTDIFVLTKKRVFFEFPLLSSVLFSLFLFWMTVIEEAQLSTKFSLVS